MQDQILKFCLKKGILLDRNVVESFNDIDEETAKEIINKLSECIQEKVITKASFSKNIEKINRLCFDLKDKRRYVEKFCFNLGLKLEITKEKVIEKEKEEIQEGERVRVLTPNCLEGDKIRVEDFVTYLRFRFNVLRSILQERQLQDLISLNKLNGRRQNVSIIGMVVNKRVTKNKNLLFEIEDLTGRVAALINNNRPDVFNLGKNIVLDDVIGLRGAFNGELFFINEVIYPDSILPEKKKTSIDESVAFISDIHIGSSMFLEKNFLKFIKWLNGEQGDKKSREEARKIKYLFITGDSVDGVGIFPGQEEFLGIKDIRAQYEKLAELLSKIRKDITIIICPGQHDAVRVAEPQPAISEEYARGLYEFENLILVSNPAAVEINGFRILMYHGASMNGLINDIEELRMSKAHDNPARVVKHLLMRRHLAPTHSSVVYIPGKEDSLVIKEVPDVITTGDLHKPDVDMYNNVLIIASSCWQSTTPFEEKVGNHPDPCKVPVLNLKTRAVKILDFSGK